MDVYYQGMSDLKSYRKTVSVVLAILNVVNAIYIFTCLYEQFIDIGFAIALNQWCILDMLYLYLTVTLSVMLFKSTDP